MRGQHDRHVQAWVRDRVRVLEMLAECARIQTLLDARVRKETQMFEWSVSRRIVQNGRAVAQTLKIRSL